jgi:tRNA-specific 2-thiouridylase
MRTAEEQIGSFDKFATGHYARVVYNEQTGRHNLLRGIDPVKDQSYFLYRLTQNQLSKVLFPLGGFTKQQIRETARGMNLPVKQKQESQDFFNGNYRALVSTADVPGMIISTSGAVIGEHKGIWNFTPGQRRGMGIGYSEPLYVVRLNPADNTVVAGTRDQLYSTKFTVSDLNLISVEKIESQSIAAVKIRSVGNESPCEVIQHDDMLTVKLLNPLAAVSPGQSAVFYDGDTVIGGGFIDKILR